MRHWLTSRMALPTTTSTLAAALRPRHTPQTMRATEISSRGVDSPFRTGTPTGNDVGRSHSGHAPSGAGTGRTDGAGQHPGQHDPATRSGAHGPQSLKAPGTPPDTVRATATFVMHSMRQRHGLLTPG